MLLYSEKNINLIDILNKDNISYIWNKINSLNSDAKKNEKFKIIKYISGKFLIFNKSYNIYSEHKIVNVFYIIFSKEYFKVKKKLKDKIITVIFEKSISKLKLNDNMYFLSERLKRDELKEKYINNLIRLNIITKKNNIDNSNNLLNNSIKYLTELLKELKLNKDEIRYLKVLLILDGKLNEKILYDYIDIFKIVDVLSTSFNSYNDKIIKKINNSSRKYN